MISKIDLKPSKFSKKTSSSRKIVLNNAIDKELSYLRCLLPSLNSKPNTSKLVVINETVKYIEQLEKQVMLKWSIQQRLINQRSINEQQQIRRLVINHQIKLKKNQPKIIGKK